jgi:predicted GH43/DUF377 family glycosyl hydrolase
VGHDGVNARSGLAISEDGITFVKHGVVIPLGAGGEFDDVFAYAPAILERDGQMWVYYTGFDGATVRTGLAISEDGITFVKQGVVIPLGAGGEFDDVMTYYPAILERDGQIWMYYAGYDGGNLRIGLAISEDGITFVKHGVVIPLGASGEFDDVYTYFPAVLERDGQIWMYYAGLDGATVRTGLAISEDGITFVKHGVVIPLGASGEFDDGHAYAPVVLERDGQTWVYYAGYDGGNWRIGLAISEDGF